MRTTQIKAHLLQRRQDLLARYHDELGRAAEELESQESEEIEKSTEQWDARVLSLLGDADAAALARIVAALRRVEDGTYGACLECNAPIDRDRLAALPEAATCIDCAVDAELRAPKRIAL